MVSCQRPKRRYHAVDRVVLAVTLVSAAWPAVLSMKAMTAVGSLAPKVTKATSCARISREKLHKPRRCDPMVTEDLVADPDHISPAIRRLLRLGVGETPSGT